MALLDAKCTSCGAATKVNGALDAAVCEFCGTAFVVEKAVRNFYVNTQEVCPASPQAPVTNLKNRAKTALVCGLCSSAIVLVFGIVVGLVFDLYSDDYLWFALFGVLGMALGIGGIISSAMARKESAAQNAGLVAAGHACSVIGLVLASIMTFIYSLLYFI